MRMIPSAQLICTSMIWTGDLKRRSVHLEEEDVPSAQPYLRRDEEFPSALYPMRSFPRYGLVIDWCQ